MESLLLRLKALRDYMEDEALDSIDVDDARHSDGLREAAGMITELIEEEDKRNDFWR
jgi:hypothetical protein